MDDNYTHAIIINCYMPELKIAKENVIGISHEPNIFLFGNNQIKKQKFIEYAQKYISKFYVGDKEDLPEPFIEGQNFFYYNKNHFYNKIKTKFCSIVVSKNIGSLNYNYRHQLVKAILNTNLPIDIYGYGVEYYQHYNDDRVKHKLDGEYCPDFNFFGITPFEDYKFHICIENVVSNNYFSEKISNPLLSNNIPIYYGCKKIDNYFNNIIKLSGNIEEDINLLVYIYKNQDIFINTNSYTEILDKLNIFKHLHILFDDISLKA
jgi:hypothetical protein